MKNNPSKTQLIKSLDRRVRHLMVQVLEKFEDIFSDLEDTRDGQIFKGDLRNAFNDVMRAQRSEIEDYYIEYRPLSLTDDNILTLTRTFIQTVQKVDFTLHPPAFKIYAKTDKRKVMGALRNELGTGVLYEENENLILEVAGLQSCVDCVLPVMDQYILHSSKSNQYRSWRFEIIKLYRSQV